MIRKLVVATILLTMSGLLIFGAVHRTGHVLASEGTESGAGYLEQTVRENDGTGSSGGGLRNGLGNGTGQGAHRGSGGQGYRAGTGEADGGTGTGEADGS
jgi:hypothetical protein